jgi:hypothetical protein
MNGAATPSEPPDRPGPSESIAHYSPLSGRYKLGATAVCCRSTRMRAIWLRSGVSARGPDLAVTTARCRKHHPRCLAHGVRRPGRLPIATGLATRRGAGSTVGAGRFHRWRHPPESGTTKNSEGRTFPFAQLPELATLMQTQQATTRTVEREQGRIIGSVFHVAGERTWPKTFYRHWWKAARAAEIYREQPDPRTGSVTRGPLPHDFRRTVVRSLEKKLEPTIGLEPMTCRLRTADEPNSSDTQTTSDEITSRTLGESPNGSDRPVSG